VRIDGHQHFWDLSRGDYQWLTPRLTPIYRDFLPEDLVPVFARHGIEGTVLVQAAASDAETDFMLSLADGNRFIRGVVGWVDFADPASPDRIGALARHPLLKGLRPMIQDIADDDWMLRPELDAAFLALIEHNLTFDALILPRHLDQLLTLIQRYPEMRVVVDHCAKPEIAAGNFDGWAARMAAVASASAAFCKLSGLVTEAGAGWSVETLRPYVEHVIDVFGPERVIWGSDWPVCTLAASYDAWCEASDVLLSDCTSEERDAMLSDNAMRAYSL
jgi:L-fuconolactonase